MDVQTMNMHRRTLLQTGSLVLLLGGSQLARGATIVAVRVWPANDYTRVTIESDTALVTKNTFVSQPPRLAVDIEGIELNAALRELVGKVRSDDPFITGVRVGQYTPTTVRLVLDLRQPVKPQVFSLEPVQSGQAQFQHRLVLDLYPLKEFDPLEALIAEKLKDDHKSAANKDSLDELMSSHSIAKAPVANSSPAAPAPIEPKPSPAPPVVINQPPAIAKAVPPAPTPAPTKPATSKSEPSHVFERFAVVALDPGHGGEDPGAIGPNGTREKDVVLQIANRLRERINATVLKTRRGDLPLRAFMTRDGFFLTAACPCTKSPTSASRFVHQFACGCVFHAQGQWCECVRTESRRSLQRRRALDGQQRKRRRRDWRTQHQSGGPACATCIAGHEHDRANQ